MSRPDGQPYQTRTIIWCVIIALAVTAFAVRAAIVLADEDHPTNQPSAREQRQRADNERAAKAREARQYERRQADEERRFYRCLSLGSGSSPAEWEWIDRNCYKYR